MVISLVKRKEIQVKFKVFVIPPQYGSALQRLAESFFQLFCVWYDDSCCAVRQYAHSHAELACIFILIHPATELLTLEPFFFFWETTGDYILLYVFHLLLLPVSILYSYFYLSVWRESLVGGDFVLMTVAWRSLTISRSDSDTRAGIETDTWCRCQYISREKSIKNPKRTREPRQSHKNSGQKRKKNERKEKKI